MNRDPIGYEGSEGNLYEYVGSRPTYRTDPSGKFPGSPPPELPEWESGGDFPGVGDDFFVPGWEGLPGIGFPEYGTGDPLPDFPIPGPPFDFISPVDIPIPDDDDLDLPDFIDDLKDLIKPPAKDLGRGWKYKFRCKPNKDKIEFEFELFPPK